MGLGQLYISLETSVLCEDWIYRGNIQKISLTSCVSGGNFTKNLYIFVRYTTKTQHGPAKN